MLSAGAEAGPHGAAPRGRALRLVRRAFAPPISFDVATPVSWAGRLLLVGSVMSTVVLLTLAIHQADVTTLLLLVFGVILCAWLGGWVAGTVANVVAVVAAWFFLHEPEYTLDVTTRGDVVRLALLAAVNAANTGVAEYARMAERRRTRTYDEARSLNTTLQHVLDNRQFMLDVSAALGSTLDLQKTLDTVTRICVPHLADGAVIRLREGDEAPIAAVAHRDPGREGEVGDFEETYPPPPDARVGYRAVLRSGKTQLIQPITDEMRISTAGSPEHLAAMRQIGLVANLCMPLKTSRGIIGALSLGMTESGRAFAAADIAVAEDVARRAAVAIENAMLYREKQERDDRFELAARGARFGTWEWDMGDRVAWSPSLEEIYGLPPGRFGGTLAEFMEHVHPDDRERAGVAIQHAIETGEDLDFEHRALWPDGQVRWLNGRGRIFRNEAGEPVRMVGVGIDITDRKLAEDAARKTEARYRALAGSLPALIVTVAPSGEIEDISDSYTTYTGLTLEQVKVGTGRTAIHPEDIPAWKEMSVEAIQSQGPVQGELRLRRHDGVYRWHLVQVMPLRDDDGRIFRWVTVNIDIEDRKRAEMHARYLYESTARLVSPLDSSGMLVEVARLAVPALADICAIGLFDHTPRTVRVEVAGPTDEERQHVGRVHLRSWRVAPGSERLVADAIMAGESVYWPDITPEFIEACAPAEERKPALAISARSIICVPLVARGAPIGMATFATTRSGRRYTEEDLTLLKEVAGRASIAIDNVRLYEDLSETADGLRRANAAKDEFLSLVSHELRTPITVILGNAQVLARHGEKLDPRLRDDALRDISADADRLNRIIENLLVLARLERGQAEVDTLRLDRVLVGLIEAHERQQGGRAVSFASPDGPQLAEASLFCVEQVMRNLLSNAEKYSPRDKPIEVTLRRCGDEVAVSVSDYGPGIAPEEAAAIFDPFYRSPNTSTISGVGIGLTVCKRLVESQSGRIWAESRPGGGATMTFTLPVTKE